MASSFYSESSARVAPCIVDSGIVCQKQDMFRLLSDLKRVRYIHFQDGEILTQGEGCILEVFADAQGSTLVANRSLYLNLHSFDYLELQDDGDQTYFDLVQDSRRLRLVPLANPLQLPIAPAIDSATLEVMMAEVLSANLDAHLDDDSNHLF
jgi:hypothetical protein